MKSHVTTPDTAGVDGRFLVERADGVAQPSSRYFVLDYATDAHARRAIRAYAESCADANSELANDLLALADHHETK
jgi:hypothetical protein